MLRPFLLSAVVITAFAAPAIADTASPLSSTAGPVAAVPESRSPYDPPSYLMQSDGLMTNGLLPANPDAQG